MAVAPSKIVETIVGDSRDPRAEFPRDTDRSAVNGAPAVFRAIKSSTWDPNAEPFRSRAVVRRRLSKDPNLARSPCRAIIVSSRRSPPTRNGGIREESPAGNPLGASALRLASRLGDESTRDTAAGWPDLINRSYALPADKWWAGG